MFHGGQDLLYRVSDAGSGPILPHGLFKAHRSVYDGIYADKSHLFKLPAHRSNPPMAMTGIPFRAACLRTPAAVFPAAVWASIRPSPVMTRSAPSKRVECNGVEHHFNPCGQPGI